MINTNIIRARSDELNIPFENMLCGCFLEEIILCLSDNGIKNFWLRNDEVLGLDKYRSKKHLKLIFAYSVMNENIADEDVQIKADCENLLTKLISHFTSYGAVCMGRIEADGEYTDIYLDVEFEKMYIPLTLRVFSVTGTGVLPNEVPFKLSFANDKVIRYLHYPLEEQVAEYIYEIISKMELLNEMENYLGLYRAVKGEAMSGRRIGAYLNRRFGDSSQLDEDRFNTLLGYRDYLYMKKKWKVMKRRAKCDVEWEQVCDTVFPFVRPIYEALMRDELFFSDWMPSLGRFLD